MKVVLADVEETALARVGEALAARGATVRTVPTDVSKAEGVEALAHAALQAFGAVHVLCNNAGVAIAGPAWEMTVADWEWVLGVNLWGVIHGVRVFVPIMLGQDTDCHVVNTASMAGLASAPMMAIYNVAKHGVVTLSETLHHDLAMRGGRIRVSVLCPGWVNTRIHESDRNRPAALGGGEDPRLQTAEAAVMRQMLGQMLAAGLSSEHVAGLVVQAIRDERFYVLPHPEWKGLVQTRMEDILAERTPTLSPVV
jgi:NAD(P)-dependent dehydrogenase (short-subunit alcohol dehydrogenase family)